MALLAWLELTRLKNALKNLTRSPARLLVTLMIVAFVLLQIVGTTFLLVLPRPTHHAPPLAGILGGQGGTIASLVAGGLLMLTYGVIDAGLRGGLLVFSPAEVDFLFPAPVPRRSVLIFKLGTDYAKVLGYVLLLCYFLLPQIRMLGLGSPAAALLVVPWLALYIIFLLNVCHLVNVLVTFHGERVQALPVGIKVGALVVVLALALAAWHHAGAGGWVAGVGDALRSPAALVLLFPLVVTWEALLIPFAGLPPAALLKLLGMFLLAAGSFALLITRRENIYEPSIGVSLLRGQIRAAMRAGDWQAARALALAGRQRAVGYQLPPFGSRGGVLLWKALAQSLRFPRRLAAVVLALTVLLPLALRVVAARVGHAPALLPLPFLTVYGATLLTIFSFKAQQGEMRRASLLKPLPIPAWQVVLAQIAPPALGTSAAMVLALAAVALAVPGANVRMCTALAVPLPALLLLLAAGAASLATLFPDPSDQVQNTTSGLLVTTVTMALMLPGFVTGLVLWAARLPGWGVGLGAGAVCAVLIVPAVAFAAARYRRFDPTD